MTFGALEEILNFQLLGARLVFSGFMPHFIITHLYTQMDKFRCIKISLNHMFESMTEK